MGDEVVWAGFGGGGFGLGDPVQFGWYTPGVGFQPFVARLGLDGTIRCVSFDLVGPQRHGDQANALMVPQLTGLSDGRVSMLAGLRGVVEVVGGAWGLKSEEDDAVELLLSLP